MEVERGAGNAHKRSRRETHTHREGAFIKHKTKETQIAKPEFATVLHEPIGGVLIEHPRRKRNQSQN